MKTKYDKKNSKKGSQKEARERYQNLSEKEKKTKSKKKHMKDIKISLMKKKKKSVNITGLEKLWAGCQSHAFGCAKSLIRAQLFGPAHFVL